MFRLLKPSIAYFAFQAIALILPVVAQADHGKYLYIQTNDIREGKNAVLGYERMNDGALKPLAGNPFYTNGTGMNNNTHAKLGPHDNDTPLIISDDGMHLFAVNTHSNTVAVFKIADDGSLQHVEGSPFPSEGVAPNSLSQRGDVVLVSNRNGDYHQLEALRGAAKASYVSFQFNRKTGTLKRVSKIEVAGFHKPIQVHLALTNPGIAFGNDFQVDADFDGDGKRSVLAGTQRRLQGQLHVFQMQDGSRMSEAYRVAIPETNADFLYKGSPGVPPLTAGMWTHPEKNLLYVGLVTRNELGTFRFDNEGKLEFVGSVPNAGQDICWILPNKAGTFLYTINNLPRPELGDIAANISTYDISEAENPREIHKLELPHPGESFINNRNFEQPGSTAFQCATDPQDKFLYVICQRVNQTDENTREEGNILHSLKLGDDGIPICSHSRHLEKDGVDFHSRAQGIATVDR